MNAAKYGQTPEELEADRREWEDQCCADDCAAERCVKEAPVDFVAEAYEGARAFACAPYDA